MADITDPQELIDQALSNEPKGPVVEPPVATPELPKSEPVTPPATPPVVESMPKELTEQVSTPEPTPTPPKTTEDVPLAFAAAPSPKPEPAAASTEMPSPTQVTPPPTKTPPVMPLGVKPVEPVKKKKKNKVAGVIAGIVVLLIAVVGGLLGYAYLTGEPGLIARVIDGATGGTSGGTSGSGSGSTTTTNINDRVVRSGSGSTVDNQNSERNTAINNGTSTSTTWTPTLTTRPRNSDTNVPSTTGVYVPSDTPTNDGQCMPPGGTCESGMSHFDNSCGGGVETKCGPDPDGEHTYIDGAGDFTGLITTEDNVCANNPGKVVCEYAIIGEISGGNYNAIDCRPGGIGSKANYDLCAPRLINDVTSCDGLIRQSDGESHRGAFVGCFQDMNCFCDGADYTAVGAPITGDAAGRNVQCYDDYNSDSCAWVPGTVGTTTTPRTTTTTTTTTTDSTSPSLSCTSLTKNVADSAIEIGSALTFTCTGAVTPAGATNLTYSYRMRVDAGAWQSLTTTAGKASYTVAAAGAYEVQCKACGTIDGASVCDPVWTGATQ